MILLQKYLAKSECELEFSLFLSSSAIPVPPEWQPRPQACGTTL
jgi:hypothetical protein